MSKTTQKIQRRAGSSGLQRMFITTPYQICDLPSAGFDHPFDPKEQVYFEYIGDDGQLIVTELMADPEVTEVQLLGRECLLVDVKTKASWKGVEPHVREVLATAMGSKIEVISDRSAVMLQSRDLINA
jgi:hypothetical protein